MNDSTSPAHATGVWPVMLTPYTPEDRIDWPVVDQLVDWYLGEGAAGLFATCLSSEVLFLDEEEKAGLVERVMARTAGRVPVIAGVLGQPNWEARVAAVRRYESLGVVAAILSVNEWGEADEAESSVVDRLLRFAEETSPFPLGLYECPHPYKRMLSPEAVGTLAATGRFVWMKETSADPEIIAAKVAAAHGTPLRIFNANTQLIAEAVRLGCGGYSGLASNFVPRDCATLCAEASNGGISANGEKLLADLITLNQERILVRYPESAKIYLREKFGIPIGIECRMRPGS